MAAEQGGLQTVDGEIGAEFRHLCRIQIRKAVEDIIPGHGFIQQRPAAEIRISDDGDILHPVSVEIEEAHGSDLLQIGQLVSPDIGGKFCQALAVPDQEDGRFAVILLVRDKAHLPVKLRELYVKGLLRISVVIPANSVGLHNVVIPGVPQGEDSVGEHAPVAARVDPGAAVAQFKAERIPVALFHSGDTAVRDILAGPVLRVKGIVRTNVSPGQSVLPGHEIGPGMLTDIIRKVIPSDDEQVSVELLLACGLQKVSDFLLAIILRRDSRAVSQDSIPVDILRTFERLFKKAVVPRRVKQLRELLKLITGQRNRSLHLSHRIRHRNFSLHLRLLRNRCGIHSGIVRLCGGFAAARKNQHCRQEQQCSFYQQVVFHGFFISLPEKQWHYNTLFSELILSFINSFMISTAATSCFLSIV